MEIILINGEEYQVEKWIDAKFYPKRHKLGLHSYARTVIRDRHLRYNSQLKRWEEPILFKSIKDK